MSCFRGVRTVLVLMGISFSSLSLGVVNPAVAADQSSKAGSGNCGAKLKSVTEADIDEIASMADDAVDSFFQLRRDLRWVMEVFNKTETLSYPEALSQGLQEIEWRIRNNWKLISNAKEKLDSLDIEGSTEALLNNRLAEARMVLESLNFRFALYDDILNGGKGNLPTLKHEKLGEVLSELYVNVNTDGGIIQPRVAARSYGQRASVPQEEIRVVSPEYIVVRNSIAEVAQGVARYVTAMRSHKSAELNAALNELQKSLESSLELFGRAYSKAQDRLYANENSEIESKLHGMSSRELNLYVMRLAKNAYRISDEMDRRLRVLRYDGSDQYRTGVITGVGVLLGMLGESLRNPDVVTTFEISRSYIGGFYMGWRQLTKSPEPRAYVLMGLDHQIVQVAETMAKTMKNPQALTDYVVPVGLADVPSEVYLVKLSNNENGRFIEVIRSGDGFFVHPEVSSGRGIEGQHHLIGDIKLDGPRLTVPARSVQQGGKIIERNLGVGEFIRGTRSDESARIVQLVNRRRNFDPRAN